MTRHWKPIALALCIAVLLADSVYNPEHRTFALIMALVGAGAIYRLVTATRHA